MPVADMRVSFWCGLRSTATIGWYGMERHSDIGSQDMSLALPLAVLAVAAAACIFWLYPPATEWFLGAIKTVGTFLGETVGA